MALALCFLLPGCSLIFESTEVNDGGVEAIDGGDDSALCGPELPLPTAIFRVDGHGADTLPDLLGGASAEAVTVTPDGDEGEVLAATTLETSNDGPCGKFVVLSDRNSPFVSLDSDIGDDPVSIDFWFRTGDVVNSKDRRALLTKDGSGNGPGDMGLFVVKSVPSDTNHVLFRLQNGADDSYFLCSSFITVDVWHHVAVSFDSEAGATLYVDGMAAADDTPTIIPAFQAPAACGVATGAETATLGSNPHDWLWGASNAGSPDSNIADDVHPGAIDELRFRSAPFLLSEAASVYERVNP